MLLLLFGRLRNGPSAPFKQKKKQIASTLPGSSHNHGSVFFVGKWNSVYLQYQIYEFSCILEKFSTAPWDYGEKVDRSPPCQSPFLFQQRHPSVWLSPEDETKFSAANADRWESPTDFPHGHIHSMKGVA